MMDLLKEGQHRVTLGIQSRHCGRSQATNYAASTQVHGTVAYTLHGVKRPSDSENINWHGHTIIH